MLVAVLAARGGQLCVAAGHDAAITRLTEARILVVAVHRRVADALGDDRDEVVS